MLVFASALGCQGEPEVREQQVTRFASMQRLLAAMVLPQPNADSVWIFKLMGPDLAVTRAKPNFDSFVHSLRFARDEPDWTQIKIPAGWTEDAGDMKKVLKKLRFTAKDGDKDVSLEVAVSKFPLGGSVEDFLFQSMNIWRHQLGLLELGAELEYFYEKQRIGDMAVYVVDMIGPGARAGAELELPAGKSFKYDLPKGWEKIRPTPPSQLTMVIAGDQGKAMFTVTQAGGNLFDNINRWRGQVGLKNLEPTELVKDMQDKTVMGLKGKYVDLAGIDKGKGGDRIVGVIAVQGQESWFFKLIGPKELVGEQKANFEKLVESLERN